MNILVTGAKGFIGRNLIETLHNIRDGKDKSYGLDTDITVFEYDVDTDPALLDLYCKNADFVFNLAGVNRPQDPKEFMEGNFGFATVLLETLKKHNNTCPIMISSSIQAELNNPYGESKKAGEDLMFAYGKETGAKVYVYRFTNVFGKWCRPNYNSAVATFCNNYANDLPITVNDPSVQLELLYNFGAGIQCNKQCCHQGNQCPECDVLHQSYSREIHSRLAQVIKQENVVFTSKVVPESRRYVHILLQSRLK